MSPPVLRLAIIGRPNVGKSTLFNRLYGSRRALVHDLPGVTRDRLEERVTWVFGPRVAEIALIDTGGLGGETWAEEIRRQVAIALESADAAIVVLDSQTGVMPADEEVIRSLKRSGMLATGKPVIGAVNKVDDRSHEERIADFYGLGLDLLLPISAEHGRGIDELKDAVLDQVESSTGRVYRHSPVSEEPLDEEPALVEDDADEPVLVDRVPKIAIVGRPNVGKSTLVNAVLGEERMIASPIAGTTVDSIDSEVALAGRKMILIDTAGIRRKSKTEKGVEVLSVVQTRKALERCDVAVLLLDGETGITDQDEKIGGLIEEVGCAVILAVNKWDTQRKNPKFTREDAAERIRKQMAFLRYAPLMFLSAKEGRGFGDLGELVLDILGQRRVRVPTHEFSEWVRAASTIHNPMNAKFYLSHQTGRNPPTFVCHVSDPEKVHFSLRRHLMNGIRERWGYMGSPVRLLFKQGSSDRRAKTATERQRDRAVKRDKAKKWESASKSMRASLAGKKKKPKGRSPTK